MKLNKFKIHQIIVFVMTFWSYVSLHASRQAYSNAKKNMKDDWGFSVDLEGAMDAAFLFAYAVGLYLSGYIGDIFDSKKILCIGLIGTAIIISIFGSSDRFFDINGTSYKHLNFWYFILLWLLNGLIQSAGWPNSVKIMGKWFGENHAGFIFGIWSANASVGNIIGAAMVSYVHSNGYANEYMFYLPAFQLLFCALLILLFVRTEPSQWDIDPNDYSNFNINDNVHNNDMNQSIIPQQSSMWNVKPLPNQHSVNADQEQQSQSISLQPAPAIQSNKTSYTDEDIKPLLHEGDNAQKEQLKEDRITFLTALFLPNVITYSLCYACLKAVNYTMFFWLPYFLNNTFSENVSDNLSIVYNVGQIFGGWICGILSDYLRRRSPPVFMFLLIAMPPIFLLRIQSSSVYYFAIIAGLAGFFVGGPANMISSAISADLGKHKSLKGNAVALATVAGIVDGTGSFGAATCQYIVALISHISWDLVFVVLTVLLLASATLLLRLTISEIKILYRFGRKDSDEIKKQYGVDTDTIKSRQKEMFRCCK